MWIGRGTARSAVPGDEEILVCLFIVSVADVSVVLNCIDSPLVPVVG